MKDCTIEILNVGAIKEVKLNLNKINIFMGEQSSGKSTIAKIVSFCSWVEKDVSIRQSFDNYSADKKYFIEKLETFHKMKGYFKGNSEIIYQSKTIKLHYKSNDFNISWVDRFDYRKNKISYIPSERTIAVLPEMEKVELPNNYIKSFLFDWFDARKNYSNDSKLSMLNIGIDYYYSESNKENHIQSQNDSYDILLSHASSGLQSMTPLMVMIDHLINNIYSVEQDLSYELDEVKSRVTQILITELMITPLYGKEVDREDRKRIIGELNKKLSEKDERITRYFNNFKEIRDNLFKIHSTNLIIEEPEQNLFPETQKKIIYHLLGRISSKLEHNLTLTTHSPYVLYAINNCIMAFLVNEKLSDEEKRAIPCIKSKIDPKSISIYQITDGLINCIQQDDGLIGNNFFDEQMKAVMDEFYLMLNHY